mgnify:CR=1 FL=1
MMNIIVIALIALLVVLSVRNIKKRLGGDCGCSGGGPLVIPPKDKNRSHYRYEATMRVEGMKCKNCTINVANALNSRDGTWADKVSLKDGRAHVLLKDKPTAEELSSPVAAAGYRVAAVELKT